MSNRIYVEYGEVANAAILRDTDTGRSRGFGFLTFIGEQSAQAAVAALNGQEFDGEKMNVSMNQ
ncbi:hypothetical protein HMPREF1544_11410 [Mucor circinelloides 1006PhL]|uniref:RRM domain-containing protein n=1 Tax=Mucor circinelloides f. circinelloides (strain 1006PhL) TaxID=1220926 RepID=S2IVZ8_MUCC1|nr:hypothetical protein HMPREF1544_11410 [Mucor circinelloides 1006PhL]